MADVTFHNVTKIEVLKRKDHRGFSVRDLVIHNDEYNYELGRKISTKTAINLFLDDKSAGKLVYNNKEWR
ncbi:MAG: hypothetical protein CBD71_04375 [Rickettsiales bacterium TMED211]|nr:MAG: hypothetical protein CBD71_04375 [Rickettsiales bacterium TMED211]